MQTNPDHKQQGHLTLPDKSSEVPEANRLRADTPQYSDEEFNTDASWKLKQPQQNSRKWLNNQETWHRVGNTFLKWAEILQPKRVPSKIENVMESIRNRVNQIEESISVVEGR